MPCKNFNQIKIIIWSISGHIYSIIIFTFLQSFFSSSLACCLPPVVC